MSFSIRRIHFAFALTLAIILAAAFLVLAPFVPAPHQEQACDDDQPHRTNGRPASAASERVEQLPEAKAAVSKLEGSTGQMDRLSIHPGAHDPYGDDQVAGVNRPHGRIERAAIARNHIEEVAKAALETVEGVLSDPAINWQDPAQRAKAVARMKAAEDRDLAAARMLALKQGKPLREKLADGRSRVLAGIDADGELLYYVDRNSNAAISTGADKIHTAPYAINGSGVRVGVWENDSPRNTHQEFNDGTSPRVNLVDSAAFGDHATHVTGTIAAFGVVPDAKGMAYQTLVDAYTTSYDRSEMTAAAATAGSQHATKLYLSNHSYGFSYGWRGMNWLGSGTDQNAYDPKYGRYSGTSRQYDLLHYNSPYYLAFWAAGNENNHGRDDGESAYIPGIEVPVAQEDDNDPAKDNVVVYNSAIHPPKDGEYSGGFDTLGDHTTAKNVLVVGAVNDAVTGGQRDPAKVSLTDFSATGPCDDGRIKPDVVGNGVEVYSTISDSDTSYQSFGGTSMSTPNVCGTAALLVDLYRSLNSGAAMRASTLRALLIHSATDIGNPGPDYSFGWGLVDGEKAAAHIKREADLPLLEGIVENELTTSQTSRTVDFLWDGSSPIRATLCWTDPAAAAESTHNDRTPDLVNDLNLKLIAPDGTEFYPYVMPFVGTWTVASMSENATTGINHTDNVEMVYVQSPGQVGTWTAEVTYAGELTNDSQEYGLLISGSATGGPLVSPSPNALSATTELGANAPSQSLTVQNAGDGTISYTITDDVAWLSCTPTSGSSIGEADTINVTFSTSGLSIGTYTASITITDPAAGISPVIVPVTLDVVASLPFVENFDTTSGTSIPDSWSELIIIGGATWKAQVGGYTGSSRPSTAQGGSGKNMTLYNPSTSANITRLVTPIINVEGYQDLNLSFWHTQALWAPDQDELKVYYSTDGGANWVEIAHYTTDISSWTQRNISLPSGSKTIRVAFEGIAKYGYGACLDTVSINGVFMNSVTVTETGDSTSVTEGGATDTYTVVLDAAPSEDVTIHIATDSQVSTDKSELVFNGNNWNVAQVVTVSAINDSVIEPLHTGTITHTASSAESVFDGASVESITVNITDNDNTLPDVMAGEDKTIYMTGNDVAWTPADATTLAWYDAADVATITMNGGAVSQWDDKSGNHYHMKQTNATRQPVYTSSDSMFGGRPSISTGPDFKYLAMDQSIAIKRMYLVTYYGNGTETAWDNHNALVGSADGSVRLTGRSGANSVFDGSRASQNFDNGGTTYRNGSTVNTTEQANGLPITDELFTVTSPTSRTAQWRLLANSANFTLWGGGIGEIIFTDGTENLETQQKIEGYLAWKWGMQGKLPAAHPYSTTYSAGGPLKSSAAASMELEGSVSDRDGHSPSVSWSVHSTSPAGLEGHVGFDDPTSLTATATFTKEGTYTLELTADDGFGTISDLVDITVGPASTAYTDWAGGDFANEFTLTGPNEDQDGDGWLNFVEFAFGSDPTVASSTPMAYVPGGDVTTPGMPILEGPGGGYKAVFTRRRDHATAGLTYSVEFSCDLGAWTSSSTGLQVVTGDAIANPGDYEAVSVPFPASVPLQAGGTDGPKFFRVQVSMD